MRMWRSHPVGFAALLGALAGFANALIVEIGGLLHKNSKGVLTMLWPASMFGAQVNGNRVMQTASILLIEVAANVFIWAMLFALPVAVVVAIRRATGGRQTDQDSKE